MKVPLTLLLTFFLMLGADGMAFASDDLLNQGRTLLEIGESHFDGEALQRARAIFDQLAHPGTPSPLIPYYQARVSLALVNVHAWRKETGAAVRYLDDAIESVKAAIQRNPKHSDSHRLLGEAYGRLIGLKGGMTGMLYGRRSYNEIALALKLDADNSRAFLAMGIWKLRTPKLFGGNPDEAIQHFQKALQLEPQSVPTRVWLGVAFKERGLRAEAREVFEQALILQPQNAWARSELDQVR